MIDSYILGAGVFVTLLVASGLSFTLVEFSKMSKSPAKHDSRLQ